jgi:hypothetical protein
MIEIHEMQWTPEQIASIESLARRVANAPQLNGSPKLRDFFFYVVDCAVREAPDEATEQQIGMHVFHRQPGYSSGDDSIVRSQARLLRAKLAAYFATDGLHEPIIIEIPKGQYFPIFRQAVEVKKQALASTPETPSIQPSIVAAERVHTEPEYPPARAAEDHHHARLRWLRNAIACIVIALFMGGSGGYLWRGRLDHPSTPALDAFWKPFYASNNALVIYSNPTFIGDPSTGLRLLQSVPLGTNNNISSSGEPVDETYTGTGEAEAIHILTQLFDMHSASFTLKRSRLVTWDEARSRSLIFVGAPSQNTALNDLQTLNQFRIATASEHHGYIINLHPQKGEPASFPLQSPTEETAIVALLPGIQPDTRIAVFSGLSTVGTQAAVEFLSQPSSVTALIQRVGTANGTLKPFEAVLQISTSKGVAIEASFLAIHLH